MPNRNGSIGAFTSVKPHDAAITITNLLSGTLATTKASLKSWLLSRSLVMSLKMLSLGLREEDHLKIDAFFMSISVNGNTTN